MKAPSVETNKFKLFNDPIYGFISLPSERVFDVLEHPAFQRLRRITQLGLSYLVYPGAYHTRFHHALGAMHLMQRAVEVLRSKGHAISSEEEEAVCLAILLHDVGHGPFSHALEHALVRGVSHESLSIQIMERIDGEMNGALGMARAIFENRYAKKFLHQLISSQLDMDRLDYLRRDAFYTGVTEGAVNSERLLAMLNVHNDELVIDAKGISSVEKFLVARSMMYWQVYLHKAVLSAETLLVRILERAVYLAQSGSPVFASGALLPFLLHQPTAADFDRDPQWLDRFLRLDDADLLGAIKEWTQHPDGVLSELSQRLIDRRLFRIRFLPAPLTDDQRQTAWKALSEQKGISMEEAKYYLLEGVSSNIPYKSDADQIHLLQKDGQVVCLSQAAEILNAEVLNRRITRHFVCWPKEYSAESLYL
jgi:hypothetical protein